MDADLEGLATWCDAKRDEAHGVIEQFAAKGVRALLKSANGDVQDITDAVIRQNFENIPMLEQLIAHLRAPSAKTLAPAGEAANDGHA